MDELGILVFSASDIGSSVVLACTYGTWFFAFHHRYLLSDFYFSSSSERNPCPSHSSLELSTPFYQNRTGIIIVALPAGMLQPIVPQLILLPGQQVRGRLIQPVPGSILSVNLISYDMN